jgi:hypothetical protein
LKQIYKSFEIPFDCNEANGEWKAEIRIAPNARGIDSIVPVFGIAQKANVDRLRLNWQRNISTE